MSLDPDLRAFATAKNFAALTTFMPDGHPQTHIMWVDADDEHVLVNTEMGRQKFRNVEQDPRVTITVFDLTNPYRFVEARGRVTGTVGGDEARQHIDRCSEKYTGGPYAGEIGSERVILQITPERVVKKLG